MSSSEPQLTDQEERQVEENSPPASRIVHTVVSRQGEDELGRPAGSLFWSGVAAGIAIMASVFASGALHHYLPDTGWRDAVVSLGYPLGFLIVILGRLQLFTEHTMVAVLPLAREPTLDNLRKVARLWAIVLAGNLIGALAVSAVTIFGKVQSDAVLAGMTSVAGKLLYLSPIQIMLQGIPAGFLIASVAWIRSAMTGSGFSVVATLTYAIALCGFTHVIAGAAEAFLLLWAGLADMRWVVIGFLLPALAGNIIGGTGLFTMLAHAQVKEEL